MKSIMPFDHETCIECGGPGEHTHHCIFGKNREWSDKYGLIVRLCSSCHYRLHNQDEKLAMKYRRLGQRYFEDKYGHARYMEVFGRNYLEDDT